MVRDRPIDPKDATARNESSSLCMYVCLCWKTLISAVDQTTQLKSFILQCHRVIRIAYHVTQHGERLVTRIFSGLGQARFQPIGHCLIFYQFYTYTHHGWLTFTSLFTFFFFFFIISHLFPHFIYLFLFFIFKLFFKIFIFKPFSNFYFSLLLFYNFFLLLI